MAPPRRRCAWLLPVKQSGPCGRASRTGRDLSLLQRWGDVARESSPSSSGAGPARGCPDARPLAHPARPGAHSCVRGVRRVRRRSDSGFVHLLRGFDQQRAGGRRPEGRTVRTASVGRRASNPAELVQVKGLPEITTERRQGLDATLRPPEEGQHQVVRRQTGAHDPPVGVDAESEAHRAAQRAQAPHPASRVHRNGRSVPTAV